jgi:photosystem II stability/assembly factor-like uncharacterized protein
MKKIIILLVALVGMTGAKAQWVPQNSGTTKNLNSVYFPDANIGYAVGNFGTILKTLDGGANWDSLTSGTAMTFLCSVYFTDTIIGYGVGDNVILKTINGGTNWSEILFNPYVYLNSVFFPDANTGYVVGTYHDPNLMYVSGYILKTTDGGITWTQLPFAPYNHYLMSVYFTDVNIGYAVGSYWNGWTASFPYIIKTIDGGATWSEFSSELSFSLLSVSFPDNNTGYAVGTDGYGTNGIIFKTTDAGTTWDTLLTTNALNSIYFTDVNSGYAVGNYGKIIKTIDGGGSWITQTSGTLWSNLYSVFFQSVVTGYVVGDSGIILKTTNGGLTGFYESGIESQLLKITPNPANDKITILSTLIKEDTQLSIFNVSGEKVIEMQLIDNETQIDISGLPWGVYFVRVQNDKMLEVGKMVKE